MLPRCIPRSSALVSSRVTTTLTTTTRLASTARRPPPRPSASKSSASSKASPAPTASAQTLRRVVLTGSIALITIVGAITGARLKMDNDAVQEQRQVRELDLVERINLLENRRSGLVAMRIPLEKKLADLRDRMAAKKRAEEEEEEEERNGSFKARGQ